MLAAATSLVPSHAPPPRRGARAYCSELVVKAYERAAGISLGRRERLGDLRVLGIEGATEERWGGPMPEDLVLVTPASTAADARLERVYAGR